MMSLPVVVLLSGCRVVDAPTSLQELAVYGFVHFDSDKGEPEAAVEGLQREFGSLQEDLGEGLRVNSLATEDLEIIGVDQELTEGVLGSAATVRMASSLDDAARAWSHPHLDEILEATLEFEILSEDGERTCFLSRECETYVYDGSRLLDMKLLGTATQEFRREFRWVEDSDDERLLTVRELAPAGAEISSGLVAVHQQYSYTVFWGEGDGTQRLEFFWIEAEAVGLDLPDAFALDLAVDSMKETAEQLDAWIAANP
jgi:hypothetical protein